MHRLKKLWGYSTSHKKTATAGAIIIILVVYGLAKAFGGSNTESRYIITPAEKGTIISAITGTGQVSASNQIDIKSRASGDLLSINVKTGDQVRAGQIIASLDGHNALIDLENAKIALAKLTKPADAVSQVQTENALTEAKSNEQQAFTDAASNITKTFVDAPTILSGLNELLNNYQTGSSYFNDLNAQVPSVTATNYQNEARASYSKAKRAYDLAMADYQQSSITRATSTIPGVLGQTYLLATQISEAVKKSKDAFDYIQQQNNQVTSKSQIATTQTNLNTWTSLIATDQSNLVNSKNAIDTANRTIREKSESLVKLNNGADALDIRSQQLAVEQREYAYADYFIRAPFDGVIGKLDINAHDTVSSGATVATIVSQQKVADISLNEVDATKIKVGNKVSLTFDAIDDLTIAGQVGEVDLVGTVTQGVVTYNVKITFNTQDERIKSGMSVTASIITDIKPDVIMVPNSAIKMSGADYYVQVVKASDIITASTTGATGVTLKNTPEDRLVTIGLANDTDTEIISGLAVDEQVITRTVAGTKTTATAAPSLFGSGGRTSVGGAGRATSGR